MRANRSPQMPLQQNASAHQQQQQVFLVAPRPVGHGAPSAAWPPQFPNCYQARVIIPQQQQQQQQQQHPQQQDQQLQQQQPQQQHELLQQPPWQPLQQQSASEAASRAHDAAAAQAQSSMTALRVEETRARLAAAAWRVPCMRVVMGLSSSPPTATADGGDARDRLRRNAALLIRALVGEAMRCHELAQNASAPSRDGTTGAAGVGANGAASAPLAAEYSQTSVEATASAAALAKALADSIVVLTLDWQFYITFAKVLAAVQDQIAVQQARLHTSATVGDPAVSTPNAAAPAPAASTAQAASSTAAAAVAAVSAPPPLNLLAVLRAAMQVHPILVSIRAQPSAGAITEPNPHRRILRDYDGIAAFARSFTEKVAAATGASALASVTAAECSASGRHLQHTRMQGGAELRAAALDQRKATGQAIPAGPLGPLAAHPCPAAAHGVQAPRSGLVAAASAGVPCIGSQAGSGGGSESSCGGTAGGEAVGMAASVPGGGGAGASRAGAAAKVVPQAPALMGFEARSVEAEPRAAATCGAVDLDVCEVAARLGVDAVSGGGDPGTADRTSANAGMGGAVPPATPPSGGDVRPPGGRVAPGGNSDIAGNPTPQSPG
ncbi:hypothetical protein GPECTOR_1g837 [Gonium pectorale]|uniref:Uncharacterized protein n=1 Tax=Gonium pectorale TaxID=33097 RepID=A0A150H514_GONPE|nr:hypothetical protein GPECTOR_1g837 [Gonium pectorale]|eukprot:KXZ56928.1 hypothetical protein GPECTOR_1g837 [Gonium pectorale]